MAPRPIRIPKETIRWLMEKNEPSVRYYALTRLLGRTDRDTDVEATKAQIGKQGWAAKILARQKERTWWDNPHHCYIPKYTSCVWNLIVLADLGVTRSDIRISNACEHFMKLNSVDSGGFSLRPAGSPKFDPHVCLTGNMVASLNRLGYSGDARVSRAADWLVSQQLADGGWNCYVKFGSKHSSFKSTIEPLWALAEALKHSEKDEWKESAAKGAEFLLRHHLYRSESTGSVVMLDFTKLHYPLHYHYDILHGLRVLRELDLNYDPRLDDALRLLLSKRTPQIRWPLEGTYRGWIHPESADGDYVERPEEKEVVERGWGEERTLQLEEVGKPSKWITMQAIIVLSEFSRVLIPKVFTRRAASS